MNQKTGIGIKLIKKLAFLDSVPERDPEKAKIGRSKFIKEAQLIASAVSFAPISRHKRWILAIQSHPLFQRKETSPMFSTMASVILIVMLVLGGGTMTIASAQGSQPDQPLYGMKVFSEDFRLGFTPRPQSQFQLTLKYTNRRAEEIQKMFQNGQVPTAAVQQRYQKQIERTIQYALKLQGSEVVPALKQLRNVLQNQEHALVQAQINKNFETDAAMNQIRNMLQERIQWVGLGISDPAQLRNRLTLYFQEQTKTPPGPQGTNGSNPWTTGTPTPGSGYGPGPNTPTPQGGNPWTTGTPTPGSGYGPGPGPYPTKTCTPLGGIGPNPQPTQQQTNQPTQAGPKPTQNNQPTQAGPQPTSEPQNTPIGPGPQGTKEPTPKNGN